MPGIFFFVNQPNPVFDSHGLYRCTGLILVEGKEDALVEQTALEQTARRCPPPI